MLKYFFFICISLPKKSVKRIEIVWTLELLTDKISRFLSYDRPSSQNNIWTTWICDRKWRVVRLMVVEKELGNVTTAEFHKQAPRHQGHGKL